MLEYVLFCENLIDAGLGLVFRDLARWLGRIPF